MKKKKLTILSLLLAVLMLLTSCGSGEKTYAAEEYILEMDYKDGFRILQLGDIHLANKDDRQIQYDFIELTINDADADLIVLNGDMFTFADKTVAKELFKWIDGFGIPWAVTFGNHDEQNYFSVDWLTSYLNNFGSNCIFKDIQDDDVYGNCNYAINLKQAGKTKAQIILMDSNRYNFQGKWSYDYIKPNQIDWYETIVKSESDKSGMVPGVLFFHIPFPEFADAWDAAQNGDPDAKLLSGEMNEDVSCPPVNTGLFNKILELGSTKAVCCSHDHVNNFRILYKDVILSYGINADDRIYGKADMMGGTVVILNSDGSVDFEEIYHSYDEVK